MNLALMSTMVDTPEHEMVREALELPHWKSTMDDEYDALMKNGTWKLIGLPPGKKAIGYKWVFKKQYKTDGTLDKHKAQLVARGYAQEEGIDYEETFAPIVKIKIIRIAFAMAA